MVKVIANGQVIADSENFVVVEGNKYFPPSDVKLDLLHKSTTTSVCPWKGNAAYYHASVDGQEISDIAWYYPHPNAKAEHIKDHVAFYKNKVQFEESAKPAMAMASDSQMPMHEKEKHHHGFIDTLKRVVGKKH